MIRRAEKDAVDQHMLVSFWQVARSIDSGSRTAISSLPPDRRLALPGKGPGARVDALRHS